MSGCNNEMPEGEGIEKAGSLGALPSSLLPSLASPSASPQKAYWTMEELEKGYAVSLPAASGPLAEFKISKFLIPQVKSNRHLRLIVFLGAM